ncbi:hypothetical protein, partial [Methylocystis sp.]|uniref:hypothetical protein n=1 Tax=Methylocystis sp. TaxID=1911079 RepID=UPI0025E2B269
EKLVPSVDRDGRGEIEQQAGKEPCHEQFRFAARRAGPEAKGEVRKVAQEPRIDRGWNNAVSHIRS